MTTICFPLNEPIKIKAGQMVELVIVDGEPTIRPVFKEEPWEMAIRSLKRDLTRPGGEG